MTIQRALCVFVIVTLTTVGGCSTVKKYLPFASNRVVLEEMLITRTEGANRNKFIQIDIAAIYDSSVNDRLVPAKADAWFSERASFTAMNTKQIRIQSLQPVPLSVIKKVELPKKLSKARRVLVFVAYYQQKKYFVFDISRIKHVNLVLDEKPSLETIR